MEAAHAVGLDLGEPWLAIHPGASAPSRRYPADRFATVARHFVGLGYQVALTGTQEELDLISSIQADVGSGAASSVVAALATCSVKHSS